MLTPSEFQQWCRALHLSAETIDLIARIRFCLQRAAFKDELAMCVGRTPHARWA